MQILEQLILRRKTPPLLHIFGVHVVSIGEMTGIQALERLHLLLQMKPELVERQVFEYIRHGTLSLISGLTVTLGKIVSSTMGPTCHENDFFTSTIFSPKDHSPDVRSCFVRS